MATHWHHRRQRRMSRHVSLPLFKNAANAVFRERRSYGSKHLGQHWGLLFFLGVSYAYVSPSLSQSDRTLSTLVVDTIFRRLRSSIRTPSPIHSPCTLSVLNQKKEQSIVCMSSIGQTTMTTSPSTLQLVVDALDDYSNQTGIDLSQNSFAEKLQLCHNPNAILELLQEREKTFRSYREGNRTLVNFLSPAVRVLHAVSGVLGEVVSPVSCTSPFPYSFLYGRFDPTSPASLLSSKGYIRRN